MHDQDLMKGAEGPAPDP